MGVEEARAALRAKYPEITPEQFKDTSGDRSALAKIVAEKKGVSEEEAKKEIDEIFTANGM